MTTEAKAERAKETKMKHDQQIHQPVNDTGWVGTWHDGTLGWAMPEFLHGYRSGSHEFGDHKFLPDDHKMFLCEVIVKPVLDSRGRPIMRTAGGLRRLKGIKT